MKLQELKTKLLQDSRFREEYERYDLAFEIGQMVLEARIIKGITQTRLAEHIGTKQSGIARLESGKSLPSLSLLEKIAKSLGTRLRVTFDLIEKTKIVTLSSSETKTRQDTFSKDEIITDYYSRIFPNTGMTPTQILKGGAHA